MPYFESVRFGAQQSAQASTHESNLGPFFANWRPWDGFRGAQDSARGTPGGASGLRKGSKYVVQRTRRAGRSAQHIFDPFGAWKFDLEESKAICGAPKILSSRVLLYLYSFPPPLRNTAPLYVCPSTPDRVLSYRPESKFKKTQRP